MMNDEKHLAGFLEALGATAEFDPELRGTAGRVTEMYRELFRGMREPAPSISTFEGTNKSPVLIRDLPFYSMCVHHLVPFFGTIDIVYIPGDRLAGFGAFPKTVSHFAAKPQLQERLVQEIADHLVSALEPDGLLVRCCARQMCMEMRGEKTRANLESEAAYGVLAGGVQRTEVLQRLNQS